MKRDWRPKSIPVLDDAPLVNGVWFRSPLYDSHDHLLARSIVEFEDGLAWCGRPLEDARTWDNSEYGGLWYTNRKSAHCAECSRKETEYNNVFE